MEGKYSIETNFICQPSPDSLLTLYWTVRNDLNILKEELVELFHHKFEGNKDTKAQNSILEPLPLVAVYDLFLEAKSQKEEEKRKAIEAEIQRELKEFKEAEAKAIDKEDEAASKEDVTATTQVNSFEISDSNASIEF